MEEKDLQCSFCSQKFTVEAEWKDHLSNQHDTQVYTCELCPLVHYSKNEYMQHFDSSHKSDFNRHTCNYCGLSYKWFKFLQKHIAKQHKIEALIQCNRCGEEFYNSVAYERHSKLKHAPGRTLHKCDQCFRRFTAKAFVQLHEKFDHSPNGFKHFREYVSENLNLEDGLVTSMKKCTKCDLKFSSALYLFKHFKYTHNKSKFYKCCKCDDAIYSTRAGLSIHLYFEHGVSREHRCVKCTVGHSKVPKNSRKKTKIDKPVCTNLNKNKNDQPVWSKQFIKQEIPDDVELTNATEEEVNNLRSNIKNLFHVLSTVPPSKLRGNNDLLTESVYSINKLRGGMDKDGKRAIIAPRKHISRSKCNSLCEEKSHEENRNNRKKQKMEQNYAKKVVLEYKNNRKDQTFFECDKCHNTFSVKKALEAHITKKHNPKTNLEKNSSTTTEYEENTSPSFGELWPTPDTSAGFETDNEILVERISRRESSKMVSPAKFKSPSSHNTSAVSRNVSIIDHTCKVCQMNFHDELTLLNHLTECHTVTEDVSSTIYKCIVCSEAFRNKDLLNGHMKKHLKHEALPQNPCDKCTKSFYDKRGLYLHMLRSHGMKNTYTCKKCNFQHSNKRKLIHHPCGPSTPEVLDKAHDKENATKSPSKEIDYQQMKQQLLKMCKKEIESKKTRDDPKRVHKCLKCENKFPLRKLLLNHIRNDHKIHLFKLYKCEKCLAVFKMEDKLKQHIKLKHKPTSTVTNLPVIRISKSKMSPIKLDSRKIPNILSNIFQKNGMMYNCKICQSYFPSNELLQRHIQWEHTTNVNLHKCGQCNQVLYSIDDLELHMNNSHNTDSSSTDIRKWKKKIAINYNQQTDV